MFLVKFHSFAISFLSRSAFESYLCCADSQLSSRLYVSALWTLLRKGWVPYTAAYKFPSGRKSNASAPLPQVNTLLTDWFWSCLTKAGLHVQDIYIATCCKRPDLVCPREARKQGGEEEDLCARANHKFLFYYLKFFLPVPLGFTGQGCLPFTKSLRKIR